MGSDGSAVDAAGLIQRFAALRLKIRGLRL